MDTILNCYLIIGSLISYTNAQTIGGPCKYDDGCLVEHSFCENQRVCECKENFIAADHYTCVALIGAICETDYDCSSLPRSHCKEGGCICDKRFVPNAHNTECLAVATKLKDPCIQDNQCQEGLGDSSFCHHQVCECMPKHHVDISNPAVLCIPDKGLGDSCFNNSQCYIGEQFRHSMECRNRRCTCKQGFDQYFDHCQESKAASSRFYIPLAFGIGLFAFLGLRQV